MPITEKPPVPSVAGQGPPPGTPIRSFLLTDASSPGMACQIINLGATLTHLFVPDGKNGTRDIVLGFDDLTAYRTTHDPYFGASVGRTANRIAEGKFSLPENPEHIYHLDQNNPPNSLHGGIDGFSFRMWDVEQPQDHQGTSLRLTMVSDHMDQGFPGRLRVHCTYRLLNSALEITYEAQLENQPETDAYQTTIASLTNHAYFNLNGVPTPGSSDGLSTALATNHVVRMSNIDSYLETDSTSVPTGVILPLDKIPSMDFRQPKEIGKDLASTPGGGHGYDHFYPVQGAIQSPAEYHLRKDAQRSMPLPLVKVYSPESGIVMNMATTEPGFQLYTANFLELPPNQVDAGHQAGHGEPSFPFVGKARGGYKPYSAFCLEASKFPDAINHAEWRDQVILHSGDKYHSKTTFAFSTQ
ncbi:hypothetical protein BGZ75_003321 [Mortierella antarctica]|nr:hypothetical protein BGZ75_003321 [Mortierella antarctica]